MSSYKITVSNGNDSYSWVEINEREREIGTWTSPFPNERGNCQAFGILEALSQSDYCPMGFFEQEPNFVSVELVQQDTNAKDKLWKLCENFIAKQNIQVSETIYQTDRVIENAYEFIDDICSIVGFHKKP